MALCICNVRSLDEVAESWHFALSMEIDVNNYWSGCFNLVALVGI